VTHFGQTPSQLLTKEHPRRLPKEECILPLCHSIASLSKIQIYTPLITTKQIGKNQFGPIISMEIIHDKLIVLHSNFHICYYRWTAYPDIDGTPFIIKSEKEKILPSISLAYAENLMKGLTNTNIHTNTPFSFNEEARIALSLKKTVSSSSSSSSAIITTDSSSVVVSGGTSARNDDTTLMIREEPMGFTINTTNTTTTTIAPAPLLPPPPTSTSTSSDLVIIKEDHGEDTSSSNRGEIESSIDDENVSSKGDIDEHEHTSDVKAIEEMMSMTTVEAMGGEREDGIVDDTKQDTTAVTSSTSSSSSSGGGGGGLFSRFTFRRFSLSSSSSTATNNNNNNNNNNRHQEKKATRSTNSLYNAVIANTMMSSSSSNNSNNSNNHVDSTIVPATMNTGANHTTRYFGRLIHHHSTSTTSASSPPMSPIYTNPIGCNAGTWTPLASMTYRQSFIHTKTTSSGGGGRIVTCGYWDHSLKVHTVDTLKETISVAGGHRGVISCIVSGSHPDDPIFISGGMDGCLKVWILEKLSLAQALTPEPFYADVTTLDNNNNIHTVSSSASASSSLVSSSSSSSSSSSTVALHATNAFAAAAGTILLSGSSSSSSSSSSSGNSSGSASGSVTGLNSSGTNNEKVVNGILMSTNPIVTSTTVSSSTSIASASSSSSSSSTMTGNLSSASLLACIHSMPGHASAITAISYCTDLDLVWSGDAEGVLCIHTVRQGEFVRSLKHMMGGSIDAVLATNPGYLIAHSATSLKLTSCWVNGQVLATITVDDR
jgi:trimeric autotransporter adhesin